jgi:sec-independent protein translocase protein TatB
MNLGMPEMIFIFLIALLIFGPRKLPEIGRQVGKFMSEFRRASNEFKYQLEDEVRQLELSEAEKKRPEEIEVQRRAYESMGENTISTPKPAESPDLTTLPPPSEETVSTTIAQLHGTPQFEMPPQPERGSVAPLPYELEEETKPQDQGANA